MIWIYLFAGLLLLTLAAAWGCWRFVFYSPKPGQNDDERIPEIGQMKDDRETILAHIHTLKSLPYEPLEITSCDGLKLRGRLIRAQRADAPLSLCFHGYHGTPYRDFAYGALGYLGLGHHVLLVEERAQYGSEGHTITMGVREQDDCQAWAHVAALTFPESPIFLCGVSMGAATVLLASRQDLPAQVKGLVADASYTSAEAIVRTVARGMHLGFLMPLIRLGALLFGHFRLSEGDVLAAVRQAKRPILLIHGEADPLVPCEMGREIAAANPAIEFHTFENAGHVLSYLEDEERYLQIVQDFETRCLEG